MRGKPTRLRLDIIFQSLKELLLSEIEGHDEFITEINQQDTFYLARKGKLKETSYFASVQIRIHGVCLQFDTSKTPFLASMPFLSQYQTVKIEPVTQSLIFIFSIKNCEKVLRELIRKAIDDKN